MNLLELTVFMSMSVIVRIEVLFISLRSLVTEKVSQWFYT